MRISRRIGQWARRAPGLLPLLAAALLPSCQAPEAPQHVPDRPPPSVLLGEQTPTTQPGELGLFEQRHPAAAEASLAAMLDADNIFAPPLAEVDREATLAGLAEPEHETFDLDGDGVDERLVSLARWVRVNGRHAVAGDALDNRPWVIIQTDAAGQWRAVHRGHGSATDALGTAHAGWRDLQVTFRLADGVSIVTLYRHDGQSYRIAWSARVLGLDDRHASMRAAPIPDDVLMRIVHDTTGPEPPEQAEVIHAAAFRGDLDGDGVDELLVQVDSVRVNGRTLRLAKREAPGNLYLYTMRNTLWEHVLRAKNLGSVRLPLAIDSPGLIVLETLIRRRGQRVTIQWYHVRDGEIVQSGTRERTEP